MEKQKKEINDWNYFQRKINEKAFSGHKRSNQKTTSVPRRTQPHSQPTQQQLPTSNSTKREDACVCSKNNSICTRLLAKNLHVYVTFGQKSTYVHDFCPKTCIYREYSGKKEAKGQTNKGECQWMNIL